MLPKSESLESLLGSAKEIRAGLKRLKGAEVTSVTLKASVATLAREWLRVSGTLRLSGVCDVAKIEQYDVGMRDLLASAGTRARASALLSKLEPFVTGAVNDVVVPVIQHEGSPRQVAARQVAGAFAGLQPDESNYVDEASRCMTVQCHRAAIIMLWAAGVARIHAAIGRLGFSSYNLAVDSTAAKKGQPFSRINASAKVSSLQELQRSKESDVLIVGMDLFGYDLQVYQELDRLLGVRNGAAHPGMSHPNAPDVLQFASKLESYVFQRIPP